MTGLTGVPVPSKFLGNFFISFNSEKRQAVVVVTGTVKNKKHAVITSGKLDARLLNFISNNSKS